MVHAVDPADPGDIGRALGRSAWLDVDGDADSKWCPEEGEVVVGLLKKLAAVGSFFAGHLRHQPLQDRRAGDAPSP